MKLICPTCQNALRSDGCFGSEIIAGWEGFHMPRDDFATQGVVQFRCALCGFLGRVSASNLARIIAGELYETLEPGDNKKS